MQVPGVQPTPRRGKRLAGLPTSHRNPEDSGSVPRDHLQLLGLLVRLLTLILLPLLRLQRLLSFRHQRRDEPLRGGESRPSAVGAARTGVATNGTPASGQPTIPEVWTPATLRNKRKDYNVLADKVSRHYPLRFSANSLHLKSGEPSKRQHL